MFSSTNVMRGTATKKLEIGSHIIFWRPFWFFLSESLTLWPKLFSRPLPSNWYWKRNFCIKLKWLSTWAPHYFSCGYKDTDISQGSVATQLRCGEIFGDSTITNFLLILTMKKFEDLSIFDEVIKRTKCAKFFGPPCNSDYKNSPLPFPRSLSSSCYTRTRAPIV